MILESAVREKLAAVARRELALEDLADWIDSESWNMHSDSAPEAIELVSSIHSLLSERDDRILNDGSLRDALLSLLNNVSGSLAIGGVAHVPALRSSASKAYLVQPAQRWTLPVSA